LNADFAVRFEIFGKQNMSVYRDATILLTGACGSVGTELLSQLSLKGPRRIIALDNNENAVFQCAGAWRHDKRVEFVLGDIRDLDRLNSAARGMDVILHTAAYKHVALCESYPSDAVSNNINGTKNVIEAALRNDVRRTLFTSSDKAVNPTTVMGATKLIGEQLMRAANTNANGPIFASIRFGNILGSSGSVVPIFMKQIAAGGPVTVTDPRMTRFVMSISEAGKTVLHSLSIAKGGEVFTTKMPAVNIKDLADAMIGTKNIEIQTIGARTGEKLHEELFNADESRRIIERGNYFVIQTNPVPRLADGETGNAMADFQNSSDAELLSKAGILRMLKQLSPVQSTDKRAA
jgi:FlaA1/EpsC-like NDP-sugar epimerase